MTMNKKGILLLILFLAIIVLGGCETAKGVACGVGATAEGAAKDTGSLWQGILKTDAWIQKNLW